MDNMHGKWVILYFLLLAVLVGLLRAMGINPGMEGILGTMAGAGILLLLAWVSVRAMRRRMASYGLSGKQRAAVMMGYSHAIMGVVDADPPRTGALVPQPCDLHPALYAGEDE